MSKNREKKDPVILLLDLVIVVLLFVMIYTVRPLSFIRT